MKKNLITFWLVFLITFSRISPPVFAATINAPIYHEQYFLDEYSSLYNYNPDFIPNTVTFDCYNHPYIRTTDGKIQIMGDDKKWTTTDLVASAKAYFAQHSSTPWNTGSSGLYFRDGTEWEDRVVFDDKCNAYTYLDTTSSSLKQGMLLYSRDQGKSWETYLIPKVGSGMMATLEYKSGSNSIIGPPTLLIHRLNSSNSSTEIYITKPVINSDNTLTIPTPTLLVSDSLLTTQHSGAGGNIVTHGTKSYILYPSNKASLCPGTTADGKTPTMILEYDNSSHSVSTPKFLGCGVGDPTPDPHENSALAVDSHGYLYVIIGSHQQRFQYLKSNKPYDISSWSKPVFIGEEMNGSGGYTYVSLIIDSSNTLHIAARWAGRGYYFRLVYMRKPENKPWDTFSNTPDPSGLNKAGTSQTLLHKELVIPWHDFYAVWRQKLDIDNEGRLFLNYSTFDGELNDAQVAEYNKKYPEAKLIKDDPTCVAKGQSGQPPYCEYMGTSNSDHDPVLMVSEDHGNTWKLVDSQYSWHFTTPSPSPIPTTTFLPGDLDKNGKVDIFDYNTLVGNFGKTGSNLIGDINNDGKVDIFDYNQLVGNFGKNN